MAVWYLDNDDEITDAVARLRDTSDDRVVFVVPPGARIATGRINFKLLAREAAARDLSMAIASPDEQVRALATSAGVLAVATTHEAEAALERGDEPPTPASTVDERPEAAAAATAGPAEAPGRSARRLTASVIMVLAAVVIAAVAGLQVLPTAEITLTPRTVALGPIEVGVVATSAASEIDPETGSIPAVELPIPLVVEGVFAASGTESVETFATGEVLFSSPDQGFDQEIVAGTRVRTPAGIEFQTTEAALLPRTAIGAGPSEVTAAVKAVRSGDEGNVPAGSITVVPSLETQGISVTNPEATSGGRFEQTPVVTRADYDAATVDLRNRLAGSLAAYLREPANTPQGLTVFRETAQTGPVTHTPPADELVGRKVAEFALSGEVAARVLAVDTELAAEVTRARLLAEVPDGMATLPGSIRVATGEGTVDGERVRFTGTGSALVYPLVDEGELLAQVAGLPVSDARAILEAIGTTTVSVWPDFLDGLPADRDRITLDVIEPSTSE